MTDIRELMGRFNSAKDNGKDDAEAIKEVVKGMFWTLVVAEGIGRRNGKLVMIGEMTDSSEAVAHRLIEEVLNSPSRLDQFLGRKST